MFAGQKVEKKSSVGSYYELLAHADPGCKLQSGKQYREGCTEAAAQSFWKRAVEVDGKDSDSRGTKYFVWVVSASFCAMLFISSPRYLEGDRQ